MAKRRKVAVALLSIAGAMALVWAAADQNFGLATNGPDADAVMIGWGDAPLPGGYCLPTGGRQTPDYFIGAWAEGGDWVSVSNSPCGRAAWEVPASWAGTATLNIAVNPRELTASQGRLLFDLSFFAESI